MKLSIPEELLLLALDDDRGSAVSCAEISLPYALAGAVLFELAAQNFAEIDGKHVRIQPGVHTGDGVLDLAIEVIGVPRKPKTVKSWVQTIASRSVKIKSILFEELVSKGILRKEEHRFLWVIPYDRYPTRNLAPENEIRNRMIDAVEGRIEIEERDYILLSLIKAATLEKEVFPKELFKQAKSRLKLIAKDEKIGCAVNSISQEIQAAITVALIVATTTASVNS